MFAHYRTIILFTMLTKLSFIICILIFSSSIFTTHSSHTKCLHHQKTLLLQLKHELSFNSSISTKLVQWKERDECCKWYGVECDAAGYVVSLQLDDESISGGIGDSSSLFRLKYLEKLNLAKNYFGLTPIPEGIHNLSYLTHLNLSHAGFGGQVPAEMLSLKRLVSLDISGGWLDQDLSLENPNLEMLSLKRLASLDIHTYQDLSLESPNLEMLAQNLTGLRELYLDYVNITSSEERRKWSHILSSYLPNLTSLSLRGCDLSGPFAKSFLQLHSLSILRLDYNDLSEAVPDLFTNFPSLTTLSLANCYLNGTFPNMIFQIPTLQNLDLSWNRELSGSIPPFTQNGSLQSIVVSETNFSESIPSSISNLKYLSYIDLSFCQFTGSIPSTFANLTELVYVDLTYNLFTGSLSFVLFEGLSSLVHLDLRTNSFTGSIPQSLFGLPSLQILGLADNRFTGQVEEFHIVNVSNIDILDLSGNRLEGPIPDSFFQLQSLKYLLLHDNLFNDTFQLDKIHSSTNLTILDLSNSHLSVDVGDVNSSTYGPPHLQQLSLVSCNMSGFPHFLKHSDITDLDLSNNRIVGEIPSWIWGKQLEHLNLSLNLLTDMQKPYHIPASLKYLDLRSNQLRGKLHLLIPPDTTPNLEYLLLSSNSFSGSIPTSLCNATKLRILDLSANNLSGTIPSCLLDDTMGLNILDLGRNNISGRIPNKFPLECSLQYVDLNHNILEGKLPKSLERCKSLQFMNIGNNIINDTFPCMLSPTLRVLVLHSNRFHGEVTCHNSWPKLQIVDISSNNFSGNLESINFSSWRELGNGQPNNLQGGWPTLWGVQVYKIGVRLTMKGLQQELHKIWPEFNAIDFSCNNFQGQIPNAIGDLHLLHVLNFSYNALNGGIPKSFGQLNGLESLDLSQNQLSGEIPVELAQITFLSVLNLSYNNFVGEIPNGHQLQTFSADSFKGNPGLCGFNLNKSCNPTTDDGSGLSPGEDENEEEKSGIKWEYVCAALGYVVGLGSIMWLLLFCRSFKDKYFGKIEEVVEDIFNARDMRRRHARRAARNRVRRQ